jgi:hypothetical protein
MASLARPFSVDPETGQRAQSLLPLDNRLTYLVTLSNYAYENRYGKHSFLIPLEA